MHQIALEPGSNGTYRYTVFTTSTYSRGIKTKLGPITCKGDKPSDPTICGVLKRYQREG